MASELEKGSPSENIWSYIRQYINSCPTQYINLYKYTHLQTHTLIAVSEVAKSIGRANTVLFLLLSSFAVGDTDGLGVGLSEWESV